MPQVILHHYRASRRSLRRFRLAFGVKGHALDVGRRVPMQPPSNRI